MQIDFAAREVSIKIVYYGALGSGKSTNIQALYEKVPSEHRSKMMTLRTHQDETLCFDFVPLSVSNENGELALKVKLFTVPGQHIQSTTRRLVLLGTDGVIFIADSRVSEIQNNAESFFELRKNIRENGMDPRSVPTVIQLNKRDLSDIRKDEELTRLTVRGKELVFPAVATIGFGVVETFIGALSQTLEHLETAHNLGELLGLTPNMILDRTAHCLGESSSNALLHRRFGASGTEYISSIIP